MTDSEFIMLVIMALPGIIASVILIIFQRNYKYNFILKPMKWFNVIFCILVIQACLSGYASGGIIFILFLIIAIPILFIIGLCQDIIKLKK